MSKTRKNRPVSNNNPVPQGFILQEERLIGAEEARELVEALEAEPTTSIRINRRKVEDIDAFIKRFYTYGISPVPWCSSGFYLDSRPDFVHDPLLHAGAYYVQEAASMIYETILNNLLDRKIETPDTRPLLILDLCAAPGGKTTAMLNALTGRYLLVANEFDSRRCRVLKENLDKWGDPNVIITNSDSEKFSSLTAFFDIVAVDAPCSGEGMMRREPMARSQWSPKLVEQCSALQKEILSNACKVLRPDGVLIYSTCTFNECENEENVRFLTEELGLHLLEKPLKFMPHRHKCEGLFVAVFKKSASGSESSVPASLPSGIRGLESVLKKAGIKIVSSGTEQFSKKGDIEIPSSRSVLAHDFMRDTYPAVELSLDDSLSYLRRNSLMLPPDTPTGYVVVCFEGYPLGLVKNIGSRANNLYPAEWRILS